MSIVEELERWRARDPIARVERSLLERDPRHREAIDAFDADVAAEIERAVEDASGGDAPGAAQLFAHVYADPPPRLGRQRAEREDRAR